MNLGQFTFNYNVVYRDLKPQNILLDSKLSIKIADFGLCNIKTEEYDNKTDDYIVGTTGYKAPELLNRGSHL